MTNYLKTLRHTLIIIQKYLEGADAKFTARNEQLLVYILEAATPVSYNDIEDYTGIKQTKATSMTTQLISFGVVMKTVNREGRTAFAPTPKGEELKAALIKKLSTIGGT